jgi:hypothetical protein
MVLKRIGVWSAARIAGALYAAMGLIIGAVVALFSAVGGGLASIANSGNAPPAWIGLMFGVGAVIFLPIFYGLLGFIMAAIGAALYNLISQFVGGLEIDLQ